MVLWQELANWGVHQVTHVEHFSFDSTVVWPGSDFVSFLISFLSFLDLSPSTRLFRPVVWSIPEKHG